MRTLDRVATLATAALLFAGYQMWRSHAQTASEANKAMYRTRYVDQWRSYGDSGQLMGARGAPVTIVAFVDYQCPICRSFDAELTHELQRHPGKLAVVVRQFPVTRLHEFAWSAALATECAADQGRFANLHAALYEQQDAIDDKNWPYFADEAQVPNKPRFLQCIQDSTHNSDVVADVAAARAIGIIGTPSYLINDSLYVGYRRQSEIDALVDNAASAARRRPESPSTAPAQLDSSGQ